MAVKIRTHNPQLMLEKIKHLIDNGEIKTWVYDKDGDFTHNADQWLEKAWFTPYVFDSLDLLYFGILGRKGVNMTIEEFSIYHGRFIEMLIKNFIYDIDFFEILSPKSNDYDTKQIEF